LTGNIKGEPVQHYKIPQSAKKRKEVPPKTGRKTVRKKEKKQKKGVA